MASEENKFLNQKYKVLRLSRNCTEKTQQIKDVEKHMKEMWLAFTEEQRESLCDIVKPAQSNVKRKS